MRVLVSGDLQIDASDSGSERAEQTRNTLAWILGQLDEHRPDMFVHLGDYGEDNRGVDHYSLTLMTWFASEVFRQVPQSYWLVGNHDYFTEDGSVNLASALGYLFPENHHVAWPWCHGPEGTMFVSFLKPGGQERFRAENGLLFGERDNHVLFSHLPVTGAMYGPNRFEENGIDPSWFPKHTIVGHYHQPNLPDPTQTAFGHAIWYAGSPMSHDFRDNVYGLSESQQLRGVWLFDIENGSVASQPVLLPNPHCTYYLSFSSPIDYGFYTTDTDVEGDWCVKDAWFTEHCIVPLDRTKIRVTVPKGHDEQARSVLAPLSAGLTVLQEGDHAAPQVQTTSIDPDSAPEQAVVDYVDGLEPEKLKGLDPATLKQTGVQLVRGNYRLPEGDGDEGQADSV